MVQKSRVEEARWVRDGERGGGGFDLVGVKILRLVAIFEGKVLEERVGGKRGCEEIGGEEMGRVREDCGLGLREEERGGGWWLEGWLWWRWHGVGFFRRWWRWK